MKIARIIRELNNYLYLGKQIRLNRYAKEWAKWKLRVGWFNTIYFVVNLTPDVAASPAEYHQRYVLEQLKPVGEYMTTLNLQEIVTPRITQISNVPGLAEDEVVNAYLVRFVPLFKDWSWWWTIKWGSISMFVMWLQLKFNFVGAIYHGIEFIFQFLHKL